MVPGSDVWSQQRGPRGSEGRGGHLGGGRLALLSRHQCQKLAQLGLRRGGKRMGGGWSNPVCTRAAGRQATGTSLCKGLVLRCKHPHPANRHAADKGAVSGGGGTARGR